MPVLSALAQPLMAYSPLTWAVMAVTTIALARYARVWGVFGAHFIVAAVVAVLDIGWLQQEMSRPDWLASGGPDFDVIFLIGTLFRIVLINAVLLPVAGIGIWLGRGPAAGLKHGPASASAGPSP